MGSKTPSKPADALSELDLLSALLARAEREAGRRNTTGGQLMKTITHDARFWPDLKRREAFLMERERLGPDVNLQSGVKTRSISLEIRDKVRIALERMESERVLIKAATAA